MLQVFKQIDFLRYMGVEDKKIKVYFNDVINWMFAHGSEIDAEQFSGLFIKYEGRITPKLLTSLFKGMSEAMTNCIQHAYTAVRRDGLKIWNEEKSWWMFSQEKDGFITVALCDLGVGIPETFPKNHKSWWEDIMHIINNKPSDSEIIQYATSGGISRTGKHYRGKGLKQAVSIPKTHKNSFVYIYSNKGVYFVNNGKDGKIEFHKSINGTIIVWRIPLLDEHGQSVVA